jgi:hypothetical protein
MTRIFTSIDIETRLQLSIQVSKEIIGPITKKKQKKNNHHYHSHSHFYFFFFSSSSSSLLLSLIFEISDLMLSDWVSLYPAPIYLGLKTLLLLLLRNSSKQKLAQAAITTVSLRDLVFPFA